MTSVAVILSINFFTYGQCAYFDGTSSRYQGGISEIELASSVQPCGSGFGLRVSVPKY